MSPTENAAPPIAQTLRGAAAATADPADTGHPRKWFILAAVSLGMFMSLLDMTIVNIAMPEIIEYFNTSVTSASWVLNAYSLTLGVLFLSMGRLADKFGQKRIFLMGLSVFTVFSLLCGLSPGIGWLIAFRVGQAVGGAAMAPISLAILMTAFPTHQRGAAIGIWGALGSVAAAVGPTLGGILVTYGAWHWIFFVNIPIGIFALVFAIIVVPERRRAGSEESVDVVGVAVSAVGLFCLTLALLKGNDWGWSSASRSSACWWWPSSRTPLFMWWEHRTRWPMFDFRLLRIRSFAAANTTMMFIGATLGGSMLLLVLFMVTVLGYTELKAAMVMTAAPVVAIIVGPIIGRYVDRIGPRAPAAIGAALFSVSMLLFAGLDASASQADMIWRGAILGLGLGFTMPTVSAAAMGSVPDRSRGVASGALNMMRQIGFTLGIAILVSLFTHAMTVNTKAATTQAVQYVQEQSQLPAQAQQQIVAALEKDAAAGANGAKDALKNAPKAPAGTPQAKAQEKLVAAIGAIFKNNIAKSFPLPFYFAALAAALAIVPALMTGRRLGEDLGHETMTRAATNGHRERRDLTPGPRSAGDQGSVRSATMLPRSADAAPPRAGTPAWRASTRTTCTKAKRVGGAVRAQVGEDAPAVVVGHLATGGRLVAQRRGDAVAHGEPVVGQVVDQRGEHVLERGAPAEAGMLHAALDECVQIEQPRHQRAQVVGTVGQRVGERVDHALLVVGVDDDAPLIASAAPRATSRRRQPGGRWNRCAGTPGG